jgi:hypothetical protein
MCGQHEFVMLFTNLRPKLTAKVPFTAGFWELGFKGLENLNPKSELKP